MKAEVNLLYKVGDIYKEEGIYFIVTELINNQLSESMPLSRWILLNYIGSTQDALEIFKEKIFNYNTTELLNNVSK